MFCYFVCPAFTGLNVVFLVVHWNYITALSFDFFFFFFSGCSYSLIHPGMGLSNNFCLMQMPGCVKEEVVRCTHRNTQVHLYNLPLTGTLSHTEAGEEEPYLNTDDGMPFVPVFRHIRLQYIINDLASARMLERDNILPRWDFPGALGLQSD